MPKSRRRNCSISRKTLAPLVELWILRLLVPLGAHRSFISDSCFRGDEVARLIGLGHWIDTSGREFDARAVRVELRRMHEALEAKKHRIEGSPCLRANIARLKELVGLSDTDCRVLEFVVVLHRDRILEETAEWLGLLSISAANDALAVLLDLPEEEIRSSLSPQGILARTGLVTVDRFCAVTLRYKFDLLSSKFADSLMSNEGDPVQLLRGMVAAGSPPQLELKDYGHIEKSLAVLQPYLKSCIGDKQAGVNVLLHGDPGTGKSQLVKVLAREFECELLEIASEDSDGDPISGDRRLRAFRIAQSFFAHRKRALILFDEVEDVFKPPEESLVRSKGPAQTNKAWINRVLEENAVPTVWVTNSIEGIDPAFIRRFDMVVELPVPPRKKRERMLQDVCGNLLAPLDAARIADSESLAPAVVTRAAKVVGRIRGEIGEAGAAGALELLIDNTLTAQGHRSIRGNNPNRLPELYDPAFIHADADLDQVGAGLVQEKSGRLCLYGPPGTGKSAYGRWLAEQMGVPLMVKRASELISRYAGGSEKNIARAFLDAERESALLLIDEVDSFLQDRRGAHTGWEVTLVNEMLTRMEAFPGVLIGSTNLMDGLDPAALRRFDLKVKFDFLRPEQARELFERYCAKLKFAPRAEEVLGRLARLRALTPGDFAAVFRQTRFRPIASAEAMVAALEAECAVKKRSKPAIGFHS